MAFRDIFVGFVSTALSIAGFVLMLTPATFALGLGLVLGGAAFSLSYSIVSGFRTPKARAPKTPAQVFDFMGAEARADEGAIVQGLWGRNKIGGQIIQMHRTFSTIITSPSGYEYLTMIIGLGEGTCHIFDDYEQMSYRIFVNDQPLNTYKKAEPPAINYYWFTRGGQTAVKFPEWIYDGTKVNYQQSAVLENNGDEFVYALNNNLAERVKVGLAFMKGLYTLDVEGDDAGTYEPSFVTLEFSYRDKTIATNPWIPVTPDKIETKNIPTSITKASLTTNTIIGISGIYASHTGGKYAQIKSVALKMGTVSSNVKLEILNSYRDWQYSSTGIILTFTTENEEVTLDKPLKVEVGDKIAFRVHTAGTVEHDGKIEVEYDVIFTVGGQITYTASRSTTQKVEHTINLPKITNISNPPKYEIKIKQIAQTDDEGGEEEFDEVTVAFIEEVELDRLIHAKTCLLALRFSPTAQLAGSIPRVQSIVDGRYVYTLEEGSAPYTRKRYFGVNANEGKVYGRNPACILYTIYRDVLGKPEAELDIASFIDCKDKAFANNLKFDLAVETEMTMEDFIEEFKSATGFIPVPSNGKIVLTYDADQFNYVEGSIAETSAYDFTNNTVVPYGAIQWRYMENLKAPNIAEITFRDEENDFEETSMLVVREDLLAYESHEPIDILFNGVVNRKQALTRANAIMNAKRLETIQVGFKVNTQAMHLAPRDYFRMTLTNPGWTNKEFKLKDRIINIDDPNLMAIEGIEYNPDIYKPDGTPIYTPEVLPWRNPHAPPAKVENLQLSTRRYKQQVTLYISFTVPDDGNWDYAEIYVSTSQNEDEDDWGELKGISTGQFSILDVNGSETYTIRVLSISKRGLKGIESVKTSLYIDPLLKLIPPNIEDFVVTLNNDILLFKWSSVDIADFDYYEIRQGNSWEGGELVASSIKHIEWSTLNIPLDTGLVRYWIKAVDIYEDESEEATEFVLNVPEDTDTKLIFTRSEKANNWIFHSDTTGSGSTQTQIILGSSASTTDDYYNDMFIYVGTLGGGYIYNYNGSTAKATLMNGYMLDVAPVAGTSYEIFGVDNRMTRLDYENTLILNSRKRAIDCRIYNP